MWQLNFVKLFEFISLHRLRIKMDNKMLCNQITSSMIRLITSMIMITMAQMAKHANIIVTVGTKFLTHYCEFTRTNGDN